MKPNLETYLGSGGLAQYLAPAKERMIPLVELPASLNPFLKTFGIHISTKLMNTLPLGNVKSLPAHYLLRSQDVTGKHVVESSSGNTVFSMGLLAKSMGASDVTAVASTEVSKNKLNLLRLAGVTVQLVDGPICPDAHNPHSSIAIARRRGQQPGCCNPGQYDNPANPWAHERVTGPQLHAQLGGRLGMFVAGLGTTGTLVGTARYLKKQNPAVCIGGVVRVPNNHVPGVRTQRGLDEVAFDWSDVLTEPTVRINEQASYEASLELIRSGLLVGPSSGFAYAGALALIRAHIERYGAEALRDKHVVFVCPDSCYPYIQEYFDVLDEAYFPTIDDQSTSPRYDERPPVSISELSVVELYDDMQADAPQYHVVDVRDAAEFADHHITGSTHVPLLDIPTWLETQASSEHKYVFVCSRSARSLRAAALAQVAGFNAWALLGGTAAWSDTGYPRVRAKSCL